MIKVMLERRIARKDFDKLIEALKDIRAEALRQPGYVTGETLVKGDDPVDVMTVGTWISERHWEAWLNSEARVDLDDMVAPLLLGEPGISAYKIYAEEAEED